MTRRKTVGAISLGVLMTFTFMLTAVRAMAEDGERTEELHKIELALEDLRAGDMGPEAKEQAQELEHRAQELRSMAAEKKEKAKQREVRLKVLHGKLEKLNQRIEELEGQDLSPEGTPDRWEWLESARVNRAEIVGAIERGMAGKERPRNADHLRGNLEELNHAIAKLEDQDLSPEGTPDRWELLEKYNEQRREIIAALERGRGDEDPAGRLHGIEMRMEHLRQQVGDREWTDEQRAAQKQLEDMAAETRQAMRKHRGRPQAQVTRKTRRVQKPIQRRLEVFRLEHADGHHLADLVIKFLPDGSEIAYDEYTRTLIVLTHGAGLDYVPYLLEHLDAPAVE
ncbi:hypothetical protein CMK11_08290 [Candidatus Poribacteria bacterium]|nr:hypothetical protein [Candidatus Poribacteria bacterium]